MNAETISQTLKDLADPETAEHSQRFFKTGKGEYGEGDVFLGIRVPVLRKHVGMYRDTALEEVETLLRSAYNEERLFALLLLVAKYQKGDEAEREAIYNCYMVHTRYINNWNLIDSSAPYIVGPYLEHRDKEVLYRFARSKDLWERRIAMLSTFYYIRNGEFGTALDISDILLTDTEDLIHKAVGWMLREIGKRDIETERAFLDRHSKTMPRTMLRYAIEKFPEAERQRWLTGEAFKQ